MDYPPLRVVRFGGETLTEGSGVKVVEGIPARAGGSLESDSRNHS